MSTIHTATTTLPSLINPVMVAVAVYAGGREREWNGRNCNSLGEEVEPALFPVHKRAANDVVSLLSGR